MPFRKTTRPMRRIATVVLIATLAIAAAASFALFGRTSSRQVAALNGPATPGPSEGPPPQSTAKDLYYTVPPSLYGKSIHVDYSTYDYTPGLLDPSDGQTLQGDLWLAFGNDGTLQRLRNRLTYSDGSLQQDTLLTSTTALTVFGPATIAQKLAPPNGCLDRSSDAQLTLATYPTPFVDLTALGKYGFASSGAGPQLHQPPNLTALPPQSVVATYAVPASANRWVAQLRDGRSTTFEVASDGRLVGEDTTNGTLKAEGWKSFGHLDVYNPQNVSATAFTLPPEESCHV